MEDQKLNRVFDRVKLSRSREEAMLADLLREKKEVSSMKQTTRRRIPAAALVAAALVAVLAGTALAESYFGRLDVMPVGGDFESGYRVTGAYQNVPPEYLSEELLERAARARKGSEELIFGSWSEAEEFIGLEIADNSVLEEMERSAWKLVPKEGEPHEGDLTAEDLRRCTVQMSYSLGLPDLIWMRIQYWGGGFEECPGGLFVSAFMRVKEAEGGDMPFTLGNTMDSQTKLEEYVTPSGMKTMIFAGGHDVECADGDSYWQSSYSAYFTMNGAMFWLRAGFDENSADTVLDGLKRVLDAFE